MARLDGPSREVRLLVDHREVLVAERTRMQNRLRWHLHELDAALDVPERSLGRFAMLDELRRSLERFAHSVVGELAIEILSDIRRLTERINALERRIDKLTSDLAPTLRSLAGVGALTAAKIVGEVAGIERLQEQRRLCGP